MKLLKSLQEEEITNPINFSDNEEFSDEEAKFYNEEIRKFEEGNFENLTEVSVEELEKRISILKHQLEKK